MLQKGVPGVLNQRKITDARVRKGTVKPSKVTAHGDQNTGRAQSPEPGGGSDNKEPGKRISAKALVADINAGLDNPALMLKYGLSEHMLKAIFKRLVGQGHLTAEDLAHRFSGPEDVSALGDPEPRDSSGGRNRRLVMYIAAVGCVVLLVIGVAVVMMKRMSSAPVPDGRTAVALHCPPAEGNVGGRKNALG